MATIVAGPVKPIMEQFLAGAMAINSCRVGNYLQNVRKMLGKSFSKAEKSSFNATF
jgi:hypothetical protein